MSTESDDIAPAASDEGEAHKYSQEISGTKWVARQYLPTKASVLADEPPSRPADVLASWPASWQIAEETSAIPGLRRPQAGAVHSLLGYWTTDPRQPATVVMPTGTGKTDTMVATLVAARVERLLVVVPSDVLRDQLANKFEELGVLISLGLLPGNALAPVVGRLRGALQDREDAVALASACNVVVATPNSLSATTASVRDEFLTHFSHLFIDEAHHVAAATWKVIRDGFAPKPVVQFTATPHRTDGQHLGGSLIYAFPLREAQRQGYFSKIRYQSVLDLLQPDEAIANAAVAHLRADLDSGFDHLLMARARSIKRAEEIRDIYANLAPDLRPVLIHSQLGAKSRGLLEQLRSRDSRILVCVDMFGEGFDFPQLKVAALHDQHRSLGVTLQFVGRFARNGPADLGPATVVAARSELRHDSSLRRLYAEDADWNLVVEDLSSRVIEESAELDEFVKGFGHLPDEISIHSLAPPLSTVVYRPNSVLWHPEKVLEVFPEHLLVTYPVPESTRDHILWFVTQKRVSPRWGDVDGADAVSYELYVVHWDGELGLLYIHSSDNDTVHEALARAVSGDPDAMPLGGDQVFRVFDKVQRLTPTNVGLLDSRNRSRRYTSYVGSDVTEAFPSVERQTKTQTHIAGNGFLNGERYSIAASLKGRIWSHRTAPDLREWKVWCNTIGPKIIDTTINVDAIIAGFIRPEAVAQWPALFPLGVELTPPLLEVLSDATLEHDGTGAPLHEIEFVLGDAVDQFDRELLVRCDQWEVRYLLRISPAGLALVPTSQDDEVAVKRTRVTQPFSLLANRYGIRVLLEKDSIIEPPGFLLRPNRELPPFPPERLKVLDWDGVNIRKESWGPNRDAGTVQGRMMTLTLEDEWDVVMDDDGSGEVADIVALREIDGHLVVRLVHCKYSGSANPGARVEDLYELAGQAQRSAGWRRNTEGMLAKLVRRERERAKKGREGIVRGDIGTLIGLLDRSVTLRPQFAVAIVQPGLSAAVVSANQLELLSSVDVYLAETSLTQVEVFCSP